MVRPEGVASVVWMMEGVWIDARAGNVGKERWRLAIVVEGG